VVPWVNCPVEVVIKVDDVGWTKRCGAVGDVVDAVMVVMLFVPKLAAQD